MLLHNSTLLDPQVSNAYHYFGFGNLESEIWNVLKKEADKIRMP